MEVGSGGRSVSLWRCGVCAMLVGVLVLVVASGVARADQPPAGALVGLSGRTACLALTNDATEPPDKTCALFRTGVRRLGCVNCLGDAALSPDGRDLYVVDDGTSTLIDVRRDPATGEIAQAAGPAGCISGFRGNGCARARGIIGARRRPGQPRLPGLEGVAVSPDGRNVYAAASGKDSTRAPDAVLAFRRDRSTGALEQLRGRAGCIGDHDPDCTPGHAMDYASGLVISPDGKNVYVETSRIPGEIAVLRRASDGSLHQFAGRESCLEGTRGAGCVRLSSEEEGTLVLSSDGRYAYIASGGRDDVSIYARQPTGALRPLRRCIPYVRDRACGPIDRDQGISLTLSPDGHSLYLVEEAQDRIVAFARDPASGLLTRLPGTFGCGRWSTPCPDGLFYATSLSFSADGQIAYYVLGGQEGEGGAGGLVLYRRGADGALGQFEGPYGCVAGNPSGCQSAPGLRTDAAQLLLSPDGRNAYAAGDETVTAFTVIGQNGP